MKRRGWIGFAGGVCLAACLASTAAASGSQGVISAGTGINSESYWTLTVVPGKTTKTSLSLEVDNPNATQETLYLSAVAGAQSPDGGEAYETSASGTALWVSGLPPSVTLSPGQSERLSFTVSVPATAPIGDHLAGISVSSAPAATAHADVVEVIENRVVVGLAVRVGQGTPAMQIVSAKSPKQGKVVLTVSDPGTTWLHPQGTISAGRQSWPASSAVILPEGTIHLIASVPGLDKGTHLLTASLSSTGVTATWRGTVIVAPTPPVSRPGPQGAQLATTKNDSSATTKPQASQRSSGTSQASKRGSHTPAEAAGRPGSPPDGADTFGYVTPLTIGVLVSVGFCLAVLVRRRKRTVVPAQPE